MDCYNELELKNFAQEIDLLIGLRLEATKDSLLISNNIPYLHARLKCKLLLGIQALTA